MSEHCWGNDCGPSGWGRTTATGTATYAITPQDLVIKIKKKKDWASTFTIINQGYDEMWNGRVRESQTFLVEGDIGYLGSLQSSAGRR